MKFTNIQINGAFNFNNRTTIKQTLQNAWNFVCENDQIFTEPETYNLFITWDDGTETVEAFEGHNASANLSAYIQG
jgi:hypothetical protein